jgi:hypothetical protein
MKDQSRGNIMQYIPPDLRPLPMLEVHQQDHRALQCPPNRIESLGFRNPVLSDLTEYGCLSPQSTLKVASRMASSRPEYQKWIPTFPNVSLPSCRTGSQIAPCALYSSVNRRRVEPIAVSPEDPGGTYLVSTEPGTVQSRAFRLCWGALRGRVGGRCAGRWRAEHHRVRAALGVGRR